MQIDLSRQRALVTGASRGIGRAIAAALMDSGACVVAHYHRERAGAEALVRGRDGSIALAADLGDGRAAASLVARAVDALGGLDLLVNNAGIALESPLDSSTEDWLRAWDATMAVNLTASGVLSRDAVRHFAAHGGGRIVFIASRAAFRGDTPEYLAYAASKGGMVALARSIARGCGEQGVKSFVIAPGFTRTEMADDFIARYGEAYAMKDVALDRMTEPRDIAPLVVFLASGLGDHCTGTSIDVNAASYVR
ncbi:MAG TPA: SDR family oxidoreductase [Candidatus Krumholzibacteria bacterium]|nr:SDR family oxidoreductase [Candidatus Krumholzibacteria bacterium]